ncbi:hypothetical protein D3C80_440260 [compost metagenome]
MTKLVQGGWMMYISRVREEVGTLTEKQCKAAMGAYVKGLDYKEAVKMVKEC